VNELLSYLDANGLSISFTRTPERDECWTAAVFDLHFESASRGMDYVFVWGSTMEEAAEKVMEIVHTKECFKIVRDTTERRVPLKRPEVINA
jgi:hypothetical protein